MSRSHTRTALRTAQALARYATRTPPERSDSPSPAVSAEAQPSEATPTERATAPPAREAAPERSDAAPPALEAAALAPASAATTKKAKLAKRRP